MLEAEHQNKKPLLLSDLNGLCSLVADQPELKPRLFQELMQQRLYLAGERNKLSTTIFFYAFYAEQDLLQDPNRCLHIFTSRELAEKELHRLSEPESAVIELDGRTIRNMALSFKMEIVHLVVHFSEQEAPVIVENITLRALSFPASDPGQLEGRKKIGISELFPLNLNQACTEKLHSLFRTVPEINSVAVCNTCAEALKPIFMIITDSAVTNTAILYQTIKEILYYSDYICPNIKFLLISDQTDTELAMFKRASDIGVEIL